MAIIRVQATQTLQYDNGYQPSGSVFNCKEEDFSPHCMVKVDPSVEPTDLSKIKPNIESLDAKGRASDLSSSMPKTLDDVAPKSAVNPDSTRLASLANDATPATTEQAASTGDAEVI